MLGALQRLGERWTLAGNAVRCLKNVAEIVFSTNDEDGTSSSQACSFRDSAIDNSGATSNLMWFDMFTADGMQSNPFDI
jgi:hypothetical protein